ncbi:hypothetical protein ACIQTN_26015 [Streptomyces werraensis]|uniref:hypothetical protein n=1 Tax=Streptomyces werraensis TaxID=68284 RepID=UPI0037F2ACC9
MSTNTPVDGPFPIRVNTTPSGCELDVSAFLVRAVFAELVSAADEDPEGLVEELRDMAALQRSAVHQGPDSHARHEYDACMERLVNELADGGTIPVYGAQVGRLAEVLASIAAPRPVPGQRGAA